MDIKYVLVILIIVLFVVNIAFIFYLNSEVTTLQSAYNTLYMDYGSLSNLYNNLKSNYSTLYSYYTSIVSDYNSLASKYTTLYIDYTNLSAKYATLSSEYNNLSQAYSNLSNNYITLSGVADALSVFNYLSQINTQSIENMMIGPYPVFYQITSPPGNATFYLTPSNASTVIGELGASISAFFDYISVREFDRAVIIFPFGNYTLGEGLIAFQDTLANGSIINTYAIVTVTLRHINSTNWQIVYFKVDNAISQYQYRMIETALTVVQDMETKNLGQLQSILIGPYPTYVYIASPPYMGNYTPSTVVLSNFIDTILPKEIKSLSFEPYYFSISYTSNEQGTVSVYGELNIILYNGSTYTEYTNLQFNEVLLPQGVFQVTGVNIINDLTFNQIITILPR
ncbi:hypothetical protein BFU36_08530 [Sulfolobus sp. A20]|uniref:hypothetical protein n=1 Tax=Saccharolobus sp. A20 TaxID=1891280 RepID=UPI000845E88E|nr:hypothetical protein [Sulfolobus sp. A20]AOL16740.1 hypothetical protein BFU36_08530 [Sulfolobus sp. A20]TRM74657.1 hypothetical protein DJ532_12260 [Sulfolobus sp. A20-N-F8]TRM86733.1 hypothetical protein DJ529_10535 [Sulfolobus sp. C3]TRN00913.1 hypothetical protein DJ527_06415 [Sulfolobus sp. F1]